MSRVGVVAAALLAAGIAGGLALGRWANRAPAAAPTSSLEELQASYRSAAQAVMPSVVHITNNLVSRRGDRTFQAGTGSGVIVSEDGYVLTNAHVVARAAENPRFRLIIRTYDGGEHDAVIVGSDVPSDIAVLKIDGGGPFTPARFGDSGALRVGDIVLAVGSPFELSHTVTHGIVSARRQADSLNINESFIQTDAPINPGNSGGALANLRGEVVGIPSSILRKESEGIAFAIPANLAVDVMKRLIESGRLDRGWLGVSVADVDENLARELRGLDIETLAQLLTKLGLERAEGAFVTEVLPEEPGARGGLRVGDVILEYGAKGGTMEAVRTSADLVFKVAATAPGTTVVVTGVRDRQAFTAELVLDRRSGN